MTPLTDYTKDEASMRALVKSGDLVAIFYNLGDDRKARVEWPGCMVGKVVYYGASRHDSRDIVFKFDPTAGTKKVIKKARQAKNHAMKWNISKNCEYEMRDMHVVALFSEIPAAMLEQVVSKKRQRSDGAGEPAAEPRPQQSLYDNFANIAAQAALSATDNNPALRRRTRLQANAK